MLLATNIFVLKALIFHKNKNEEEKTRHFVYLRAEVRQQVWRVQSGGQPSEERPGPDRDQ